MFRTINIVESIFWAGFWVFAIVAICSEAARIYGKRGSSYDLKGKIAFVFVSLSTAMYALMYIYIMFEHKLLFGFSFYLYFTYRLIGAGLAATALFFSIFTSAQLKVIGIIISIAILFGFCNELGLVPLPDIFELIMLVGIYLAGAFLLLKRCHRHEPMV